MYSQDFDHLIRRPKDDYIRQAGEDQFAGAGFTPGATSRRETTEFTNFSVKTAHGRLRQLWMLLVKVIRDILQVVGGCGCPTKAHSALKHPFDTRIHLRFIYELSPVSLFDALADGGSEAIILIDQAQGSVHHELVRVLLQMCRNLRELSFLLRGYVDFHIFKLESRAIQCQELPVVVT
jgi:hypothetical protein